MNKLARRGIAPRPPLLGERAFDLIRNDIIQCKLRPGTEVTEAQLVDHYRLGRAPIRSALSRLCQDGLVNAVPRRGYLIAPITFKGVQEMFDLRSILEPEAARAATGHVDIEHLRSLDDAPTLSENGTRSLHFLKSNRDFHVTIAEASGNERLTQFIASLLDDMARLLHLGLFSSGRDADSMRVDHELQRLQHQALIEAFVAGDPKAAERAAREHIEHSRELVMKAIVTSRLSLGI